MQHSLFEIDDSMSVNGIAAALGVSKASVQNWIKTGYLLLDNQMQVSQESYVEFRNNVVGTEKLIGRANKKFLAPTSVADIVSDHVSPIEKLSHQYENSLSAAFKNQEGIFYTSDKIADDFFNCLPSDRKNLLFCDPCCGTGQFLVAAIRNGFSPDNVFGFDTDANAIAIARERVADLGGPQSPNIFLADFLQATVATPPTLPLFDVIMTNPPWGKKLPKAARESIGKVLNSGKSLDTCSLFFSAALRRLRPDGYCGFLMPESFFNIATFEDARRRALDLQILSVVDYGRPFSKLLTKAIGIVVRNKRQGTEPANVVCRTAFQPNLYIRKSTQFSKNPRAIINYNSTAEDAATLRHVFNFPHETLKGRAKWGLGIVTGNNKRFVHGQPMPSHVPVWRGSDISLAGLKPSSMFIPEDFSRYQQVAPLELYKSEEKLIYRFISDKLLFFHDKEKRFILNSANMLIPNKNLNITQSYLSQYLNSKVINWIFKSVFYTHKILRGDIESLPIYSEFTGSNDVFDEDALKKYLGILETDGGTYRIA